MLQSREFHRARYNGCAANTSRDFQAVVTTIRFDFDSTAIRLLIIYVTRSTGPHRRNTSVADDLSIYLGLSAAAHTLVSK